MRRVVERKMTMDGVQFDGITFKDQLGLLKAGRLRGLVEQIGYKLQALLQYRREHPRGVRYLLFGDDVEDDLAAFLLFGEVCAGLRGEGLQGRLRSLGVHRHDAGAVSSLAAALAVEPDPLAHVFIHEVKGGRIRTTDPRVHVAPSFDDHARTLLALGKIRAADCEAVGGEAARPGGAFSG